MLTLSLSLPAAAGKKKEQKEVVTRSVRYAQMYAEQPQTIVIMPPINRTNHVEAKDYFYSTMYIPLCDKGYYVFPPMLTMEMFQTESAYDAEMYVEGSLSTFREVLGADAAMFTIIKDWRRVNAAGLLTVTVEYLLRSTKTGETLYHREGTVTIDHSVQTNSGGLFGALADLVATTISTAATDKIEAGRKCTAYALSDMPAGRYSTAYGTDGQVEAGEAYFSATVK